MFTPQQVLSACGQGKVDWETAVARLGLDSYRQLTIALADAGLDLPGTDEATLDEQVLGATSDGRILVLFEDQRVPNMRPCIQAGRAGVLQGTGFTPELTGWNRHRAVSARGWFALALVSAATSLRYRLPPTPSLPLR